MRDWWLRTLLVLQRPRPVFVALRDEDPDAVAARAEPVLLIVWLAGIAAILADATTYLDDATRDGVDLAIWVFAAGGISGAFAYFVVGWILYRVVRALGSHGTYPPLAARARVRRGADRALARPLAVQARALRRRLVPHRRARLRRRDVAFDVLAAGFCAWSVALLVIGVRSVHGWTWRRALAATRRRARRAGRARVLLARLAPRRARPRRAPARRRPSRRCASPPGTRRRAPRPRTARPRRGSSARAPRTASRSAATCRRRGRAGRARRAPGRRSPRRRRCRSSGSTAPR